MYEGLIDVRDQRQFRKAGQFKRDRKAFEDARPHIRRLGASMEPMEIIVGDVHHLDFVLTKVPGFNAYPKAICWLDMATNRIWLDAEQDFCRDRQRHERIRI